MVDAAYKIAGIMVPLVALYAIKFSKEHLQEVNRSTKLNAAYAEIDIFVKLNQKRRDYANSMLRFLKLANNTNPNFDAISFAYDIAMQEKEDFLNLLDTICLYVREGYVTKINFKRQYQDYLSKIISLFEGDFGESSTYNNIKMLNQEFNEEDLNHSIKSGNSQNIRIIQGAAQIISCFFVICAGVYYSSNILTESQNIQILDLIFPDKYVITKIVYLALVFLLFLVSLEGDPIKEKSLKSLAQFFSGIIFLIGLYYLVQKSDLEEFKDIKSIKILISLMITYFYIFFIVDVVGILINLFFTRMLSQAASRTHP